MIPCGGRSFWLQSQNLKNFKKSRKYFAVSKVICNFASSNIRSGGNTLNSAKRKMTTTKAKKTFKTMRGMEMTANKLMSAINQRFKIFDEPASIEINRSCGKYIKVEVGNRNTYMLTMVEVDIVREVVNDQLKGYSKDCWYIKFDTTPIYCAGTESFLHIPTMVIVLMIDDIEQKEK